ncbi:hypothetical protein [Pararobbsia alpina]|uniref:Uncharacterized protein n=1 Tax=Pararobbsia alpina TaxID=621374 RepID=A0A6S7BLP3_9BURK|nr:hypothetical protein [Pararobbsia alpina]CAB3804791.1 hypothetical protein LMG28138_05574 [Pararobbsia alpina]
MKVIPRIFTRDSAGAAGSLVGEFMIPLASIVGPVLAAAVTAWFRGPAGRKLRLSGRAGRHSVSRVLRVGDPQPAHVVKTARATHRSISAIKP